MDFNQRLKAISHANNLNRGDIAHACQRGGYNASLNEVKGWLTGAGKDLDKGPAFTPKGRTAYRPIPEVAFDAFCLGLGSVLDDTDEG